MATGVTSITPFNEKPYLTNAEYINAPTAIDYDNLVVGGNASAQAAELTNVILRASSLMNNYMSQNINATSQTETQRVRFTPQGFIALHPNENPVIALSNFQYGADINNLTTLADCSTVWFEDQQIIIPVSQLSTTYSSQGPLQFGGPMSGRNQVFVKYTYVSGYVNSTVLSATAAATSFTVNDATGIVPGLQLRIYDGANSEFVTVASTYTYGSTTVPTASALAYSHSNGVAVGNLPNMIKEACILITTALIKMRGDSSMTMSVTTTASGNIDGATRYGNDIALALQMVNLYRRVR